MADKAVKHAITNHSATAETVETTRNKRGCFHMATSHKSFKKVRSHPNKTPDWVHSNIS